MQVVLERKYMSKTPVRINKSTILVIGDNKATRQLLRHVLESDGYAVIEVEDGTQALSVYDQLRPDLILMDAMDGIATCARLRELPGASRAPVLVITEVEDDETVVFAFKAGASDYIVKPISVGVLRQRVSRLLHARQTALLLEQSETEYRQAEIEMRMTAKVFESIAEGIVVTDTNGIIELVNHALTVITGYSEKEVVGKHIQFLESDEVKFYNIIYESLQATGQWQGEYWLKCKSGEAVQVWLSKSAIKDDCGETVQFVGIFIDMTEQIRVNEERQRLQEQAAQAQRLASLGIMSAGIAHEINQPLNSIKVLADGMLYWHNRGQTPNLEKIIGNLQKISAQAGRIDEIIKHMRSFVSNKPTAQLAPCGLNEAVLGVLDMLGRQFSSHGIIVEKALSDSLPAVSGNASRLEEVIINLLVNAMQALDAVGRTEKVICCSTWLEEEKVVLEVSDNATGISNEIKKYIFEPFFTAKKAGEGMGLGLSIVQSIIFSFNGEIKVMNNEKGGTSFRIELPAIKNQAERGDHR
ncbi:MAG: Sensor histidine kinase TmoS [Pelotomaculum sp. PtaU1.Bin035]|nr:MAG: Sensor histidine kinase TmoS [Pelotomaculum sp. PtaU1.Bin035]